MLISVKNVTKKLKLSKGSASKLYLTFSFSPSKDFSLTSIRWRNLSSTVIVNFLKN